MARPKRGDLVVVTWKDAVQHLDGAKVPRHEPYIMKTCGWLLHKDKNGVSLAGELCSTDGTWRNENFIPGGMVKSVEIIKVTDA